MKTAFETFDILEAMAKNGNPASVSDAGVECACRASGSPGAYLNVKINAAGLKNRDVAEAMLSEAHEIAENADSRESGILSVVQQCNSNTMSNIVIRHANIVTPVGNSARQWQRDGYAYCHFQTGRLSYQTGRITYCGADRNLKAELVSECHESIDAYGESRFFQGLSIPIHILFRVSNT